MGQDSELYNGNVVIGNTSLESVESQSTQLLDFVLGRAEPPAAITVGTPRTTVDEHNKTDLAPKSSGSTKDTSLSSADVSATGPYHFHGLARTQTQTHSLDSSGCSNPRKENVSKSIVDDSTAQHITSEMNSPSYVLAPAQTTGARTRSLPSPSLSSPAPPQPTKAVTFHPPSSEKSNTNLPHKDRRSEMGFRSIPAPLTGHDSFGGPTASQVEGQVIANSSIFSRPLDKLGEPDSQEEEGSLQKSSEGPPAIPSANMPRSFSSGGDSRGYSLSNGASHGRILVSDSDTSASSQNSSHLSQEATQIISQATTGFSNPNPGSSSALPSNKNNSDSESSQEPTQILSELESTSAFGTSGVNQTSTTDSVLGGPRSLLNSIPPEKRARYARNFKDANMASVGAGSATKGSEIAISTRNLNSFSVSPVTRNSVFPARQTNAVLNVGEDSKNATSMSSTQEEEEAEQEVIPPSESDVPDASRQSRVAEHVSSETEEDVPAQPARKPPSRRKNQRQPTTPLRDRGSPASSDNEPDSSKPLAALRKSGKAAAITKVVERAASVASPTLNKASGSKLNPRTIAKRGKAITEQASPALHPEPEAASEKRVQRRPVRTANLKEQSKNKPDSASSSKPSAPNSKKSLTRSGTPVQKPLVKNSKSQKQDKVMEEEEETEVATELADDEVLSMDEEVTESVKSIRKRKRPAPPSKNTRSAKQGKQGVRATASVQRPPAKKRRISNSTANTEVVQACFGAGRGTQVFALFKGDSCYYGAEVHSLSNGRAHVKYFDGLEDTSVGIAQLRRFELHEGDTIVPESFKAVVTDISAWASENEIRVRYTEGPDEDEEDVIAADAFRVPSRSVQAQWKDRVLDLADIIPAVGKKLRDTPSPSKMSMTSTKYGKNGRFKALSKYGFVLTLKPENNKWVQEKARLEAAVCEGGGSVFSDWPDLFSLSGKASYGNKRWMLAHEEIKFVLKDKSIDKVLLLSDQHNQKPRYLIALALGIPCVSAEWVYALLAGDDCHWSKYLLPAGCSEPLGGAKVSQMVDLAWGDVHECLTEITENKVPLKVLGGKNVLCVGTELFPPHSSKSATEQDKSRAASRNVPRIIAAMGANVEAVAEIRHATHARELDQYDYIVRKDPSILSDIEQGIPVVDVTWIKECLIAGRLLPVSDLDDV